MSDFDVPISSPNETELVESAKRLLDEGNKKGAFDVAKQVLKINRHNTDALLIYAQLTSDIERATEIVDDILVIDPDNLDAKLLQRRLQRATQSVEKTKNDAPENSSGVNSNLVEQLIKQNQLLMEQAKAPRDQPVINIVNTSNSGGNTMNTNVGGELAAPSINQGAFWVGFLLSAFLGLFGISHFMNGKILMGLLWLFLFGPILLAINFTMAATGYLACIAVPLHFLIAWSQARNGAKRKT